MLRRLSDSFRGDSVKSKSFRGSGLTIMSIAGSNGLRLASNLILTRLLFPEAFGLMALVQVFVAGLNMFSETGIRTAIIRHERGDDPDFLNTAWTIQVMRGFALWLGACALAYPASLLYDTPLLALLLPVVGLNATISAFGPTKAVQANRHLNLGRITVIELASQAIGIVCMIVLAILLNSVWALVWGGLLSSLAGVFMKRTFLPGPNNRFQWDRSAVSDLFHFGKFLFLSTAATFFIQQGDKVILGKVVTLAELGVYNIAFFMATVPFMLCTALNSKIIQPLYRMKPMHKNERNRRNVFKARRTVVGLSMAFNVVLGFSALFLIDLLYDERFSLAGPIMVLISFALVPRLVFLGYNGVLLAVGDSGKFFLLNLMTGLLQLVLMLAGAFWLGMFGVVIAPAVASILVHPIRIYWIRPLKGWDRWSDLFYLTVGFALTGLACWLYWDDVVVLMG